MIVVAETGTALTDASTERMRIAAQVDVRDRLAVQLLLSYGLRKGALRIAQFKHFDHYRKRLTIFTKGERVRDVPIPDPSFWDELGRLMIEETRPEHYLLPRQKAIPKGHGVNRRSVIHRFHDQPLATTSSTTGGTGA